MEENKYERELIRLRNILFILSVCSIFLGLVVVGISANNSPIPEDPYSMIENMWKMLLIIPIPLGSMIFGIVLTIKHFKCKRNIIGGAVMTILLVVFGSFSFIFGKPSHNMTDLNNIAASINISFPDEGYVSISNEVSKTNENQTINTTIYARFNNKNDMIACITSNENWKDNIDFIPANTVPVTYTTLTANFDYYLVYNVTKKEYNNISSSNKENEFWYLSYSSSSNLLIGVNFII